MAKPNKKSVKTAAPKAKAKKAVKPKAKAKAPQAVKKKPVKVAPKKSSAARSAKPAVPAKAAAKPAAPKAAKPAKPIKKIEEEAPVVIKRLYSAKDPFLKKQKERLLQLKDTLLDSMSGVARDNLRSRSEGNEASAFDIADAGNDAYDRDFALSLISQEQDALYEIDGALQRIENGAYGVCEISGKPIPKARLEALPFTRYTVECQSEIEKTNRYRRLRQPVTSLFGGGDDDGGDDDDDSNSDSKD